MALFSSTQISWNEPWFFIIRIRKAWGWRNRILLGIALSLVMFFAIYFLQGRDHNLVGTIGISLAAGFALVALMDQGNIQREVAVYDDRIVVNSAIGYGWLHTFKFTGIQSVELLRPEEWQKPYGAMLLGLPNEKFLVAVPRKIAPETLANVLHRLGLTVTLSDWQPSESDTRVGVRDEIELDASAARGEVVFFTVDEQDGSLLTAWQSAVQIVIALGPLLLAFIGAITVGVLMFLNWEEWATLEKVGYGAGAFVGIVLAFVYLVRVGQFAAAAYGIGCASERLQSRPNTIVDVIDDNVVCVEIFDRTNWTEQISKAADYGFLRIDATQRKLDFEGNKTRWSLPTSGLTVCRIEEAIVGSEGDPNAEKRYFVVICATGEGMSWEAGLVYTRTELGRDTPESRYDRARLLFAQLATAVS